MKHINKTYYWIGLLIFFGLILGLRFFGLLTGIRFEFFYAISGLWICLIIPPLFGEIEFFGIKLKKEIEDLKNDVKNEIQSIKYEINTSNKQQVFLGYGPPPTDKKINDLEEELNNLKEKQSSSGIKFTALWTNRAEDRFDVSESTTQLFKIRYNLENLITKIWKNYSDEKNIKNDSKFSPTKMLNDLWQFQIIDKEILDLTRATLSICDSAIHGKMTSKRQRDFVIKNSFIIYDALSSEIINE